MILQVYDLKLGRVTGILPAVCPLRQPEGSMKWSLVIRPETTKGYCIGALLRDLLLRRSQGSGYDLHDIEPLLICILSPLILQAI